MATNRTWNLPGHGALMTFRGGARFVFESGSLLYGRGVDYSRGEAARGLRAARADGRVVELAGGRRDVRRFLAEGGAS